MTATTTAPAARRRGRPVLGAVAGFFFGLFVWLDLVLFGVLSLESVTFWIFPVLGIALGIALAFWAPFGGRSAPAPAPVATTTAAEPAPPPPAEPAPPPPAEPAPPPPSEPAPPPPAEPAPPPPSEPAPPPPSEPPPPPPA